MANIVMRISSVSIDKSTGLMRIGYNAGIPDGRILFSTLEGVDFASSATQIKAAVEADAKAAVQNLYGLVFGGGDVIVTFGGPG